MGSPYMAVISYLSISGFMILVNEDNLPDLFLKRPPNLITDLMTPFFFARIANALILCF